MATVTLLGVNASLAGLAAALLLGSTGLSGCAGHPLDCALGVPHADCREGTRGYDTGAQAAAAPKANAWMKGVEVALSQAEVACANAMQSPDLDPIRHKVELDRSREDLPPPFEMSANTGFPSAEERPVIARWAGVRDACLRRARAALVVPPTATAMQIAYLEQAWSYRSESAAQVSELIVGLYEARLTYGEFAQKRYEIDAATLAAERKFDQAVAEANQQRQLQLAREAREDFQLKMKAWALSNQRMRARQSQAQAFQVQPPPISRTSLCSSQRAGDTVTTICN